MAQTRRIEVEFGPAEFLQQAGAKRLRAPNLALSYGLGGGFECVAEGVNSVPLGSARDESAMRLEEVAVGVKKVIRRGSLQDESGPSFATEAAFLFPTGDETHTGASAAAIFSSSSKRGATHLNVELMRLPEGRNAMAYGLIFESGDENLAPVMQLGLEVADGAPPEETALVGLIYVPHQGLECDVALKAGQSEGERLLEARAGLTFQIRPSKYVKGVQSALGHLPRHRRRH